LGRTSISTSLDSLFDEWIETYPATFRSDFHRDGIVDPVCYAKEPRRLLYVLAEPNSRGGRYDRYRGWDLRVVFGREALGKAIDLNLARWTRMALDGVTRGPDLTGKSAAVFLRRVAIMNLKKLPGSGVADREAIAIHAWRDREFIRREIQLIEPDIVITCGETLTKLLVRILADDAVTPSPSIPEEWGGFEVLRAFHPSHRPRHAPAALKLLAAGLARMSRPSRRRC